MRLLVLAVVAVLLVACADPSTPTRVSSPTQTVTPSPVPAIQTPTPVFIPTATVTPIPAPSPAPTDTPTPLPSPTPTLEATEDAAYAELSQLLSWFDEPSYPGAVIPIVELWTRDASFGRDAAETNWIADGIQRVENDAIYGLGLLWDYDPALARQMLVYSGESPVRDRNPMFLGALWSLLHYEPDKFELLIEQPWFTDGLSAEERAFIVVVSKVTGIDDFDDLLASPRIVQSKTFILPLTGEVSIWAFHNNPPTQDLVAAVERGLVGAQRLFGAPYPLNDIIYLSLTYDDCETVPCGGVNFVDSTVLVNETQLGWGESTVYHEIAHGYMTAEFGPFWLYEGGASFAASYTGLTSGAELVLHDVDIRYCQENDVPDLNTLNDVTHPNPVAQETCGYILGEYFLTVLYGIMGEDAFSATLRELYERYLSFDYWASEEVVYRTFLKHVASENITELNEAWRRYHGGSFVP